MTIAVTGASGQLGALTLAALQQRVPAASLLALARNPQKLASTGLTAKAFDYAQADQLAPALEGVETLILISSSEVGQRAIQHGNVIAAAQQADVARIIYTSLLHADVSPLSLAEEHRATEAALKASGLNFTILRHGWYTENYLGSLAAALQNGALIGSAGEGRISSATRQDFAEALAIIATTAGHEGQTYELAGDEDWTLADLAAEVSRQTQKPVAYRDLPESDYAGILTSIGLPPQLAGAIASWDAAAAKGALFDDSRRLSRLIGRPTTPLAQAVKAALA